MSDSLSLEFKDEVTQGLRQMTEELRRKFLRSAIRIGAQKVRERAKQKVPVKTGRLRKNIRNYEYRRDGDYWQKIYVRNGKGGVGYGHLVEYGYMPRARGSGKNKKSVRRLHGPYRHVPARPYMRPALEETQPELVDAVEQAVIAWLKS